MEWHWEEPQEKSFEQLKKLISNAPTREHYNADKPVTMSFHESQEGIRAVRLQDGLLVAYGSTALSNCQQRHAQFLKELLAIVYGWEKLNQYVNGKDILAESILKPFVNIFKKSLHQAPMRLQWMLLRQQIYNVKGKYRPG